MHYVYVYVMRNKPEVDQLYLPIWPHVARIRGITYQTELYCAVEINKITYGDENRYTGVRKIEKEENVYKKDRVLIGKIPIMIRSRFCHLSNLTKE